LIQKKHPNEKILIFSQFADTVNYLERELKRAGVLNVAGVSGNSENPTDYAVRFSPESNRAKEKIKPADELRVLIATDVLSEGQNLQDAHIVINYDLPWAIIRLIQRAGRVDRIGQTADTILCYSFLPADGVERIIRLRARVRERLRQNAEVVGTDEAFFEDDKTDNPLRDLFTEKSGVLDDDDDAEVDLASQALEIWESSPESQS
jgi:Superfamily II DNA and RNA helicases